MNNDWQCTSPGNRRINNRQDNHAIIWTTEPWLFLRLLFLLDPRNKGGCAWCGNIAHVVDHTDYSFYGKPDYLNFWKSKCQPLCIPCNDAKRAGLVLCPRCKKQGHYCPPGEICWTCKTPEERERLLFQKEHRIREKTNYGRVQYRNAHPTKKVVDPKTGKWKEVRR